MLAIARIYKFILKVKNFKSIFYLNIEIIFSRIPILLNKKINIILFLFDIQLVEKIENKLAKTNISSK